MKMIKVNDKYYIASDGKQFTVFEHKVGKNKKGERIEYEIAIGCYTTLRGALRSLINYEQKQIVADNNMSLSEAVKF